MFSKLTVTLLAVCCFGASACVVRAREPVLEGEVVMAAPPAEQVEVVTVAPSPNHVWIKGHWGWRGRWVWEPGYWEVIRPGHRWVDGHWRLHRGGYLWVPGHWAR